MTHGMQRPSDWVGDAASPPLPFHLSPFTFHRSSLLVLLELLVLLWFAISRTAMDRAVSTSDQTTSPSTLEPVTGTLVAAWVLTGITLILIPLLHLVSALVAGLLVYELVGLLAPIIERHLSNRWSRLLAVGTLALLIIVALIVAGFGIAAFVQSEASSPDVFSNKLGEIVSEARRKLPAFLSESFPGT